MPNAKSTVRGHTPCHVEPKESEVNSDATHSRISSTLRVGMHRTESAQGDFALKIKTFLNDSDNIYTLSETTKAALYWR
jgi:hypothetical protein